MLLARASACFEFASPSRVIIASVAHDDETCAEPPLQTPLQVAINCKQPMIVSLLSAVKARMHFDDPASALCAAAGTGDLSQVKRIIENGVDPNLGDYDGRTGKIPCTSQQLASLDVDAAKGGLSR